MSKKTIKLISIITIMLIAIMGITTCCSALDTTKDQTQASDIAGDASGMGQQKIEDIGNSIATIIRNVGIVLAVIMLMVIGIKYMIGSAEERAEYKKTMMPYLVGAVLLFAASAIAQAVIKWSSAIG